MKVRRHRRRSHMKDDRTNQKKNNIRLKCVIWKWKIANGRHLSKFGCNWFYERIILYFFSNFQCFEVLRAQKQSRYFFPFFAKYKNMWFVTWLGWQSFECAENEFEQSLFCFVFFLPRRNVESKFMLFWLNAVWLWIFCFAVLRLRISVE